MNPCNALLEGSEVKNANLISLSNFEISTSTLNLVISISSKEGIFKADQVF